MRTIYIIIVCSVCLSAYSTVAGQCRPELPLHLQTAGVLNKAGQVSGILEELAARRELFMKGKSMVDLFPTLYYHSTEVQFRHIARYDAETAEAVLDLIILFYDAYHYNRMLFDRRGNGAVERHWKKYYKNAPKLGLKKKPGPSELIRLMLDGIDAHLTDLPRSLRFTFGRMKIPIEQLRNQYFEMETIFSDVSRGMNSDLQRISEGPSGVLAADAIFGVGTQYVNVLRRRAWEEAVSREKLKVSKPQLEFSHSNTSRKYFFLFAQGKCP